MEAWRPILVTATVNGFTSAAVSISAAYAPESIKVTDDSGKPIDNITLRVGESKSLKVTILPDAASQELWAAPLEGRDAAPPYIRQHHGRGR